MDSQRKAVGVRVWDTRMSGEEVWGEELHNPLEMSFCFIPALTAKQTLTGTGIYKCIRTWFAITKVWGKGRLPWSIEWMKKMGVNRHNNEVSMVNRHSVELFSNRKKGITVFARKWVRTGDHWLRTTWVRIRKISITYFLWKKIRDDREIGVGVFEKRKRQTGGRRLRWMRMTRDMNAIYVNVYILIYMNKPKDPILSVLSTY